MASARGDEVEFEDRELHQALASVRSELRELLARCDSNTRSETFTMNDRWKLIQCCQRISELYMTAGSFAEARVQLLLASGLWNAQVQSPEHQDEKKTTTDAFFPSTDMCEAYIACSEQVRDFVGANLMANKFLEAKKTALKAAERAFEASQKDFHELEAREAKLKSRPSRYAKFEPKITEAKASITSRLCEAKDAVEGATKLVAEWESRCRELMDAFVLVCTRDREAFRAQHGDTMSDGQIDSLMKPRYNGGWFTPRNVPYAADSILCDADEKKFVESYVYLAPDTVSIRKEDAVAGYGLFAEKDFKRGDVIARFPPYVWATVDENACAHCGQPFLDHDKSRFKCTGPCGGQETYCSEDCRKGAHDAYHKQMCGDSTNLSSLRRSIRNSGISAASRMHYIVFKLFAQAASRKSGVFDDPVLAYIAKQAWNRIDRSQPKFLLKDWQLRYDQMIANARLNGLDPRHDFYTFCLLTDAVSSNLFATGSETAKKSGAPLAAGLYVPALFLNHSCTPNASWSTSTYDTTVKHYPFVLTARRDIDKGDEIFITYTEEYELDVYKRLQTLQQFGVPENHKCTLCDVQKALAPDVALDIVQKALCEWGSQIIRDSVLSIASSAAKDAPTDADTTSRTLAHDRVRQGGDPATESPP